MHGRSTLMVRIASPQLALVEVAGTLDRDTDWSPLTGVTTATLRLDLGAVKRITSHGVQALMVGSRAVPAHVALEWSRVAVPLVLQLGMIANFAGRATVLSFYAPYWCAVCSAERRVLLEPQQVLGASAPLKHCETCGARLSFEELESDYLSWLEPAIASTPAS